MRQRNNNPWPIDFPTLTPPVRLLPGDTLDYPTLLAGLEEVESPGEDKPASRTPDKGILQ